MRSIKSKVIENPDQLDLFDTQEPFNNDKKERLRWSDSIVSTDRPTKRTSNKVLWIRPEDSLFSLFNRAAKFVQDQQVWDKEDYAEAIRDMLQYLEVPLTAPYVDFAKLNSRFLSGDEKKQFMEEIDDDEIRRVFLIPSDLIGKFYIILKSNKHVDTNHEGMFARINGKKVVFLNADSIIGKVKIWKEFSAHFDRMVSRLTEAPMDNFDIFIDVVKDMLIKGLICGTFANAHHNYSILKDSADALPAKKNDDYLDISNWSSISKAQGYAYKLFSKFIVDQYSPHAVKTEEPENADYKYFASSVLYVLNSESNAIQSKFIKDFG